jgi:hypothetical protein
MLAFHIFSHINIKTNTSNDYLCLLRFAIFHQLDNSQITGKIFLKAYTNLFKELPKPEAPSLMEKIGDFFNDLVRGIRVIQEPYAPSHDQPTTRVEIGTSKYLFDALSKGELNGYQLDAGKSPGIYVTPWPETEYQFRNKMSDFYARRYSTYFFDEPVRVVMDVPNQYLGRIWRQNCNHANFYELTITKDKLEQMRQSGDVTMTVYPYQQFIVRYDWNPIEKLKNLDKDLAITPVEMQILVEFINQKLKKVLEPQVTESSELVFGQSFI